MDKDPHARRSLTRQMASVGLVILGILVIVFGMLMLGSSLLAIGPEDEVPVTWWLIPLLLGTVAFSTGVLLSKRSPHRAPPGGW